MKRSIIPIILIVSAAILGTIVVVMALTKPDVKPAPATNTSQQTTPEPNNPYAALKGDEFDEAFIADMLAHHEGAVNMSEQAQAQASHEELKTLAATIMQAQSIEIATMKQWQLDWGYDETMNAGHMSHGGDGMDMAGDMTEMMNTLSKLNGEAFDKEYLAQMIEHHQQAIDMAQFAGENAKHIEVKQLATAIISTQQSEIDTMKQWQKQWGYE